jgi:hypothetical protein
MELRTRSFGLFMGWFVLWWHGLKGMRMIASLYDNAMTN